MAVIPHPITGVVPPATGEMRIREVYPSVAGFPALATIGRALTRTIILAPLAWLLMSLAYFAKVMPFTARRYELTNQRVRIRRGWTAKVGGEVHLNRIHDVKVVGDANSDFFRASDLHILGEGSQEPLLILPAVPEPENFRRAILHSRDAWFPLPKKLHVEEKPT